MHGREINKSLEAISGHTANPYTATLVFNILTSGHARPLTVLSPARGEDTGRMNAQAVRTAIEDVATIVLSLSGIRGDKARHAFEELMGEVGKYTELREVGNWKELKKMAAITSANALHKLIERNPGGVDKVSRYMKELARPEDGLRSGARDAIHLVIFAAAVAEYPEMAKWLMNLSKKAGGAGRLAIGLDVLRSDEFLELNRQINSHSMTLTKEQELEFVSHIFRIGAYTRSKKVTMATAITLTKLVNAGLVKDVTSLLHISGYISDKAHAEYSEGGVDGAKAKVLDKLDNLRNSYTINQVRALVGLPEPVVAIRETFRSDPFSDASRPA